MKKITLIYFLISIMFYGCSSSSEDNSNNNDVYFNFTINNKNYSTNYQGEGCWQAEISQNNSEVNFLMSYKDPSDNIPSCGVLIEGVNNAIGNDNDCLFILNYGGNNAIVGDDWSVELTEIGNFYEGTFSGTFEIFEPVGSTTPPIIRSGSGSFRVPKLQ